MASKPRRVSPEPDQNCENLSKTARVMLGTSMMEAAITGERTANKTLSGLAGISAAGSKLHRRHARDDGLFSQTPRSIRTLFLVFQCKTIHPSKRRLLEQLSIFCALHSSCIGSRRRSGVVQAISRTTSGNKKPTPTDEERHSSSRSRFGYLHVKKKHCWTREVTNADRSGFFGENRFSRLHRSHGFHKRKIETEETAKIE